MSTIGHKTIHPDNGSPGMTYREWLIGQALANADIAHTEKAHGSVAEWAGTVAGMVIACADAVIEQLDKEEP